MFDLLRFSSRCFACLALLACVAPGAGDPAPRAMAFTQITSESGVEQVVADHYAKVPKWWLSGMDLVDLTGDGPLDLVLGGHRQEGVIARNDAKGHFNSAVAPGLSLTEIHVACDLNEDRRLDLQLTHSGAVYVLRGSGGGRFAYVNREWGIEDTSWSAVDEGLCFGEIDGDGRIGL